MGETKSPITLVSCAQERPTYAERIESITSRSGGCVPNMPPGMGGFMSPDFGCGEARVRPPLLADGWRCVSGAQPTEEGNRNRYCGTIKPSGHPPTRGEGFRKKRPLFGCGAAAVQPAAVGEGRSAMRNTSIRAGTSKCFEKKHFCEMF